MGEFTVVAIQSPESPRRVATSPLTTLTLATPKSGLAVCGPATAATGQRATHASSNAMIVFDCIGANLLDKDLFALLDVRPFNSVPDSS
jgi:hypothetical protein